MPDSSGRTKAHVPRSAEKSGAEGNTTHARQGAGKDTLGPSLAERIRDPGFTPRVRDVGALVELLAEEDEAKAAEHAIIRVGEAAIALIRGQFVEAKPPLRARLIRVLGRLSQDHSGAAAVATLVAALEDSDPKTRRNAVIALGHAPADGVEEALRAVWEKDMRPEMHRSVAAALGKVGSRDSLDLLRVAAQANDPELSRIAGRACLMIERTASRGERGRIDGSRSPASPVDVVVLVRRGLEDVVSGELSRIAAVSDLGGDGPGRIRARLVGRLDALFTARTMVGIEFPLPPEATGNDEATPQAIARAAASETARRVFDAFTVGAVRYRIAWAEGGHKRAATWDTASAIGRLSPALINDPTASLWEIVVDARPGGVELSLSPRALPDPRFTWRRRDVPAASHPTIAAALARIAGARAGDVVWDPFVGSGAELVERALLGPYETLIGTDLDERALDAARENLAAARVEARLSVADAFSHTPAGVTLILTNPPMGRRAVRTAGLADRLDRFVARAATVLRRGGVLAWVTPWPGRARTSGIRAGLTLDWARTVDMGGFDAEMQRWTKSR